MTRSYRIYLAAFFLVVLGSLLIYHYVPFSAASPAAVTLDVDTTLDSNDPAYQGCTPGPNDCSLRGAISLANGDSANDYIISLPAGVYTLTLAGPNEDGNATGDLDITTGSVVTLIGVTADSTIIQAGPEPGAGIDRVFDLNNSTLALQNLTVRHGLSGSGGGFYVRMSALTLSNVIVSDNRAIGGLGGGGINGTSYAAITITNSTFRNNTTDFDGGAIVTYQSPAGTNISGSTFINNSAGDDGGAIFTGAPLTLVNSTFSKNIAQGAGGGIYFNGWETMWVTNSTFSDNFAPGFGGGIVTFNLQGTLNMYNTIIANSLGGGDCDGGIRGQNIANLIEDGSCNPAITGDPNLGPLQDNGGATLTYALLSGSPAIDAANDEVCPATDQRGEARPQDGDGDGTAACDIGSFEVEEGFPTPTPAPPPTTLTLVVDTTLDSNDPAYQACTAAPNDCTLRGAISHANNDPVNEYTLSLPAGSYTLTLAGDLEDNNATGDLDIASGKTLTVTGVAPASSIIQAGSEPGNGIDRVFHVLSGANLTVQNVSVRHGSASGATQGGGFLVVNNSTLTIVNSLIAANEASSGGGVFNDLQATTTVIDSTFSANTATSGSGGGILNQNMLKITSSRFISNTAGYQGGGIFNMVTARVRDSLFSGNRAQNAGGAIYNSTATLEAAYTVFSGNTATTGGAINNFSSTVYVINSLFKANTAGLSAGAIKNGGSSTLNITGSTFSQNSGPSGGGIINSATLNVVNSTFFDNAATTLGGGIYTSYRGTSSISNSTFFKNSAGSLGGGISNRGTLSMYNTIIAGSINGGDCWNNGAVGANVSNLIEDGSCDPAFTGDPMLGPLQNNGGPTPTHALLPGSPAIDNGDDNACTAYDQRDVFRPQDGDGDGNAACDIGAFERING